MISYTDLEISSISDYNSLLEKLPDKFSNNKYTKIWIEQLKQRVGLRCSLLRIEYPYYDSEYLSSYYQYYIKKFRNYGKESCRIHFFDEKEYLGYITVRPTVHYLNLSKSYLSPKLLLREKAFLLLSPFRVNIYGNEMQILAFPWMNQQKDFSMCAHVTAWSIMKFYGNEHTGYRDINIGMIIENISEQANRKLPSKGLNLQQIAEIFKSQDITPLIVKKEKGHEEAFYRELLVYIESGFPIAAALDSKDHMVAIVGHGEIDYKKLKHLNGIIDSTTLISSMIVNDDNELPYYQIGRKAEKDGGKYYVDDIDFAIIPLYNRVHLEYNVLYAKVKTFLETGNLDINKDSVVRIYVTSANSLKQKALSNPFMNAILKDVILRLEMPKLVWCVDVADKDEYSEFKTSARMIVDSTASAGELAPWILVHDRYRIRYFNRDEWFEIVENIEPYSLYRNNLEEMKV